MALQIGDTAPDFEADTVPTSSTLWLACDFKLTVAAGSRLNDIFDAPDVPTVLGADAAPARCAASAFSRIHVPSVVPGLIQPV